MTQGRICIERSSVDTKSYTTRIKTFNYKQTTLQNILGTVTVMETYGATESNKTHSGGLWMDYSSQSYW